MGLNSLPSGSLTDLDSDALCDELNTFLDGLGDSISWISDMFGYAAFDVLELRKKIEEKISKEDLVFLVKMFLFNKKAFRRVHQEKLQHLNRKLGIKRRANGNNKVITLFRIAQSFPDLVAVSIIANPEDVGLITLAEMRLQSDYPEFPALAIQPLLACFLPRSHKDSLNILNVFLLSNMILSETFNQKSELWGNKTKLEKVREIETKQRNHFNSVVMNENLRKVWCARLGIMVNSEYSSLWIEAATKCKAKLMETYEFSF